MHFLLTLKEKMCILCTLFQFWMRSFTMHTLPVTLDAEEYTLSLFFCMRRYVLYVCLWMRGVHCTLFFWEEVRSSLNSGWEDIHSPFNNGWEGTLWLRMKWYTWMIEKKCTLALTLGDKICTPFNNGWEGTLWLRMKWYTWVTRHAPPLILGWESVQSATPDDRVCTLCTLPLYSRWEVSALLIMISPCFEVAE